MVPLNPVQEEEVFKEMRSIEEDGSAEDTNKSMNRASEDVGARSRENSGAAFEQKKESILIVDEPEVAPKQDYEIPDDPSDNYGDDSEQDQAHEVQDNHANLEDHVEEEVYDSLDPEEQKELHNLEQEKQA